MPVIESMSGERKGAFEQRRTAKLVEEPAPSAAGSAEKWCDARPYANPGDRVLVLGSGDGALCFSLAELVGKRGQVVGIESDSASLASARELAFGAFQRLGFGNVTFCSADYGDLRLDLEVVTERLQSHPVRSERDLRQFEASVAKSRLEQPLVPDGTADLVVFDATEPSLHSAPGLALFREIHRVLAPGGRCILALVTADEETPSENADAGPYNGAPLERRIFEDLETAGLYGMSLLARDDEPFERWGGAQFRRMSLVAYKGKEGPCWERVQAVLLRGPFRQVTDDDGHVFVRGVRTAVCEKTFKILNRPPYNTFFEFIEPEIATSPDKRTPFPCASAPIVRKPAETKTGSSALGAEAKSAKSCC